MVMTEHAIVWGITYFKEWIIQVKNYFFYLHAKLSVRILAMLGWLNTPACPGVTSSLPANWNGQRSIPGCRCQRLAWRFRTSLCWRTGEYSSSLKVPTAWKSQKHKLDTCPSEKKLNPLIHLRIDFFHLWKSTVPDKFQDSTLQSLKTGAQDRDGQNMGIVKKKQQCHPSPTRIYYVSLKVEAHLL